jgi:hypothetical protein
MNSRADYLKALSTVSKIVDLFLEAGRLFNTIPPGIQKEIREYHSEKYTMQHCIKHGLQAAADIRENWNDDNLAGGQTMAINLEADND